MQISKSTLALLIIFSVGMFAIVTSASTRLSGNTLTFDVGKLENINDIDIKNNTLILNNGEDTIFAVFNAPTDFPIITAQQMGINFTFPNTTTAFFGDVNNIDDINGFSRFSETNLNNGSGASAGFNAVNDIGQVVNFGIGSSNFQLGNESLANQGAIASFTDTGFDFVNSFLGDWRWRHNPAGNLSFPTRETVMILSNNGSLTIEGNFSGNQFYGEMFVFAISGPITISIPTLVTINSTGLEGVFTITNFTRGRINGFTFFNDTLIANVSGMYNVRYSVSYENAAQGRHAFVVTKNNIPIPKTSSAGYVANANDIRTVNGIGLISLDVGDVLAVKVGDRFNPPSDIDVLTASFSAIRVGS